MKLIDLSEDKKPSLEKIKKQMIKWCEKNIDNFKNDYDEDDPEMYDLIPESNKIFGYDLFIDTEDTELPYSMMCGEDFIIKGKNLISFKNFPDIDDQRGELPMFSFDDCVKLDFKDFFYPEGELKINFLYFSDSSNINPRRLNTSQQYTQLHFLSCDNPDILNIDNYTALDVIEDLQFENIDYKIQNLTSIFDTNIKKLYIDRGEGNNVYGDMQRVKLNDIIEKYLTLGKSHAMDMAVELTDSGFEDEV